MAKSKINEKWEETIIEFEEYLLKLGRSENSVNTYGIAMRSFGRFYRDMLNKPGPYVSKLQETDLHAFIDYLRSTRYMAASSVNTNIAAFHAFSRYILEKKLHRRNIASELKTYFVKPSAKISRLSAGETRRLITSINMNSKNGIRDAAIIQLLLQCGLRVGEITYLCLDDIEINKKIGRIRIRDKKTRSERIVPLNASVRNALSKYIEIRGHVAGTDPLFLSQRGKKISVKNVKYLVKKYLCMAGRSDLSARDLRHNLAKGLFEKTGDLTVVQHVLGHRNIATTARYIQPAEKEIASALEELSENVYHGEQGV